MGLRKRSRSVGSEDDSAHRAESSVDEEDVEEGKESENADEDEDEDVVDEEEHSSESGTDGSEVGAASSTSDGSEDEDEEDEDDDVSDTDAEAEQGDHHNKGRNGIPRSVFLKTSTHKAVLQPGERNDRAVPTRFPQKPMVEMLPNSNIWYQAYIIKESANEVKVRLPGFGKAKVDKIEWLKKSSSRVWTGSYKSSDWKHLGKGAWEPRVKAAGSRQAAARSGSAGPAGSGGRGKARGRKYRRDSASGTPEVSSDADGNEGYARQGAQQRLRSHSPASKGKPVHRGQGSKGRAGEGSQDGLRRMVVTKRKAEPQLSGGPGGEEEVVSPRPGHAAALAWDHDGHEHPAASRQRPTAGHSEQRQQSQQQQQRRQQRQPAADEHHSEGEHYWSTHSPNVAESPVVFVDQNSSRSSQDHGAAAHNSQVHDPDYDPLRKWFEVHFEKLQASGKLCSLPVGMCEAGVLPDGFALNADKSIILANTGSTAAVTGAAAPGGSGSKTAVVGASAGAAGASPGSAAVKPSAIAGVQPAGASPTAPAADRAGTSVAAGAAGAGGTGATAGPGSEQGSPQGQGQVQGPPKKKRLREDGTEPRAGKERPVKHILVKQVPPQPVRPGPAASVDERPAGAEASGSGAAGAQTSPGEGRKLGPTKDSRDAGLPGVGKEVSPSGQKGREVAECRATVATGGSGRDKDKEAGAGGVAKVEGTLGQHVRQHAAEGSGGGAAARVPVIVAAAAGTTAAEGTGGGCVAGAAPAAAPQQAGQAAPGTTTRECSSGAAAAGQAAGGVSGSQRGGAQAGAPAPPPPQQQQQPPQKLISKHPSKDRLGRRIVMSESSDEDDDRLSPRQPTALTATATLLPVAVAVAAAGTSGPAVAAGTAPSAGGTPNATPPPPPPPPLPSAPPSSNGSGGAPPIPMAGSVPAQGVTAVVMGVGMSIMPPAAASTTPSATAAGSSALTKGLRDEAGLGQKSQQSNGRSWGPGASKEGTPVPGAGGTSSGPSSSQQRAERGLSEGGKPSTVSQEPGKSAAWPAGEGGRVRSGEVMGEDGQRGSKPGGGQGSASSARPPSPLLGATAVKPQEPRPKVSEPDRVKGPPVLATDDIEF